jgi:predicted Zn-dependent protease
LSRAALALRRAAALVLALALAGGCAGAPPAQREPSREERDVLERQQRVSELGGEFPFLWDPEVVDVVRATGGEILRAVGAQEDQYHFYVLDKPVLNAFTSPNGDVFFFTGQLTAMRNRSELAGVLAHEIAHVRAGHYERISRTAALGAIPAMAAIILSGGSLAVLEGTLAALEAYQLSFSREMESEADRLSLVYIQKTGFDPRGLIGSLQLIEKAERLSPSGAPSYLETHPETAERIVTLENAVGLPPGEPYHPAADPAWDRVRAIILARDSPEEALREFGARARTGGAFEHDLLGVVEARRGNVAAAAEQFRLAVAGAPGEAQFAVDLGGALWSLGDAAGARAELERALRLPGGGSSAVAQFLLGELQRAAGRKEEARARYERATELAPQLSEAHYQLALALSETPRLGEADFHFGRAAELRGDYVGAMRSYRRAREHLGTDPLWAARIAAALKHME